MYQPTTALYKIAALNKPIRVIQGSQSAGKTVGILMLLINSAIHNKDRSITIAQNELSKARRTVIRDFVKIMKSFEFYKESEWNKSESIYRFSNGSYIEFMGLDSSDIGKGFRRDILYINECNKPGITLDTFIQLQSRCNITYVDFNPDNVFWIHTDVIKNPNADFIILTYLDNEFVPKGELDAILSYKEKGFYNPDGDILNPDNVKSKYWSNKWIVYGLGLPGTIDGSIYSDWEIVQSIPEEAELIGSGLDFGYSQDPSACVRVYRYNNDIIVDEVLYMKGLGISDMSVILKESNTGVIYCDSADPRSIAELRKYGIRALPAKKGSGSVLAGIELLRSKHMLITSHSKNLIVALKNYSWDVDKDGNSINKPSHLHSDIVDALRYLAISKLSHHIPDKEEKKYSII